MELILLINNLWQLKQSMCSRRSVLTGAGLASTDGKTSFHRTKHVVHRNSELVLTGHSVSGAAAVVGLATADQAVAGADSPLFNSTRACPGWIRAAAARQ